MKRWKYPMLFAKKVSLPLLRFYFDRNGLIFYKSYFQIWLCGRRVLFIPNLFLDSIFFFVNNKPNRLITSLSCNKKRAKKSDGMNRRRFEECNWVGMQRAKVSPKAVRRRRPDKLITIVVMLHVTACHLSLTKERDNAIGMYCIQSGSRTRNYCDGVYFTNLNAYRVLKAVTYWI